jgi:hypothetical protein
MDKEIMVYKYNGILFSLQKKEYPDILWQLDEPAGHMLSKISQTQKDKYSMIAPVRGIWKSWTHGNRMNWGHGDRLVPGYKVAVTGWISSVQHGEYS